MNNIDYQQEESDASDEEWEDQDVIESVKCLFCNESMASVELAITHCKSVHQFDFRNVMKKFNMDCYSFIKFVNFIRQTGVPPEDVLKFESPLWNQDMYLKPVLEFDPWLMFDFEDYLESNQQSSGDCCSSFGEDKTRELQAMLQQKDDQIVELMNQLSQMKNFVHKIFEDDNDDDVGTSKRPHYVSCDNSYFESYSHLGIHFDMLADEVRTVSYRNAILTNGSIFANKTVLDLGCGTGILSMFAVTAGAQKVIAIDNSDIVTYTYDIVSENRMMDKIDVIKSRLEDTSLPVQQVDIIVSEWMGYFLLFEGMLDSLIYARDRYLKSGGVLVPDKCDMFLCGANDPEGLKNNSNFWNDVYGYRMSCIKKETMKQAVVDVMPAEKIVTSPACIASFNLYTCTVADTTFESTFELNANEDTNVTTLVGYFDVFFDLDHKVYFSTGPQAPVTHWKQAFFHIYEPISLKKGEMLKGILKCERSKKSKRSLKIIITIDNKEYVYDLD